MKGNGRGEGEVRGQEVGCDRGDVGEIYVD